MLVWSIIYKYLDIIICGYLFVFLYWVLLVWGMGLLLYYRELLSGRVGFLVAFNRES